MNWLPHKVAEPAFEGNVYKIDLRDGKPAHYWIVLNDAQGIDGSFAVVSLTDRRNLDRISDVWPFDYPVTPTFRLAKPSIVALRYAQVKTQVWLDQFGAEFVGRCTPDALKRVRCNFFWYPMYLSATVKKYVRFYETVWNESCGTPPPHQ